MRLGPVRSPVANSPHFPQAKKIVLVMDNLNTHSPASLYEAFRPDEAKRIADRLEIHYTPKPGSWVK